MKSSEAIPAERRTDVTRREFIKIAAVNERETIGRYRERIRRAEAMGEFALSETLRAIIVQEQEHEFNLSAALGINVPLPK